MTQVPIHTDYLVDQYDWTLEKYHYLVEQGILTKEDRVELLFGKLIKMSPIGRLHAACVRKLARFFAKNVLNEYELSQENPITLPDDTEPEPDFVIADLKDDSYASGHPQAQEIHLVVEVSDHTVAKDRGIKLLAYAKAGIPEYWIINLIDRQIEQHLQPQPDGSYAEKEVHSEVAIFSSPIIKAISVADILP